MFACFGSWSHWSSEPHGPGECNSFAGVVQTSPECLPEPKDTAGSARRNTLQYGPRNLAPASGHTHSERGTLLVAVA